MILFMISYKTLQVQWRLTSVIRIIRIVGFTVQFIESYILFCIQ